MKNMAIIDKKQCLDLNLLVLHVILVSGVFTHQLTSYLGISFYIN